MKICLSCEHRFEAASWRCPRCHQAPPEEEGVLLFAPSLAQGNGGFKAEYFRELAGWEASHFWFRNRNRLLVWAMGAYFPAARRFLEIGCGTGFVLGGLQQAFGKLELAGGELFLEGLSFARSRLSGVPLYQMDAVRVPFEEEFDTVGAFDVLEHIEEDEVVLRQMRRAVKPGGGLLLTVPQHPWLWSAEDSRACHQRRYTRQELVQKVESAGFKVRRVTSFVALLLPLLWASRRRPHPGGKDSSNAEFRVGLALNCALETVLRLETSFIRRGVDFPAGGSLLLAAQRN